MTQKRVEESDIYSHRPRGTVIDNAKEHWQFSELRSRGPK
jgi:hypothetical protein